MDDVFLIDPGVNKNYSYQSLLKDIGTVKEIPAFLRADDLYRFYCTLLASVLHNISIEVLDADLSLDELRRIEISDDMLNQKQEVPVIENITSDSLIQNILKNDTWTLTLYTSGTTGRPKKVYHTLKTLTRTVKRSAKLADKVWALAYNPTHYAGLQVFFQALCNLNPVVYVFGQLVHQVPAILKEHRVTNLSATPSYYKMFLPLVDVNETMERLTFGGERMDETLLPDVKRVFPNAEIRNIYASTEAGALFTSDGNEFSIPLKLKDKIRILNTGELLIHASLLGGGVPLQDGEWFSTGDLVESVGENRFRFISRKTEMINVGGYKVNPNEVEAVIRQVDGVADVLVSGKENRLLGHVLLAHVVKQRVAVENAVLKERILKHLAESLQSWKCPRVIYFVDHLELSRTGKKVRPQ